MFGTADVVARSMPVYGAFNPWWVLIWLALMAGCLLLVAGVVALVRVCSAARRTGFSARGARRKRLRGVRVARG